MAVDRFRALLAGGYGGDANRLALVALDGVGGGECSRLIAEWGLPLRRRAVASESERAWEHPALLTGRGNAIHLVNGDVWSTWRVEDFADVV